MSFIAIAREFLEAVSSHLDEHTTEKGRVEVDGSGVTLLTPSHIQYAKYGRGPGKMPPVENILEYVGRKGIIFDNTDQKGTAWAIAISISKKGTSNWVPNAPNAIEEAIEKEFEAYSEELAKFFRVKVQEDLKEVYDKQFPEKQEYKI